MCFVKLNAQNQLSADEYIKVFSKLDSLLIDYEKYAKLKEIGAEIIDDQSVNRFKSLFVEGATIEDELTPQFFDGSRTFESALNFKKRTLQEYIEITRNQFPEGLSISIMGTNISLNQLDKGFIYVVLKKKSGGVWKEGGNVRMESICNVELMIEVSKDFSTLKIRESTILTDESPLKFEKQIPNFKIYGDDDRDFIANNKDNCEDLPSFASKDGCPTREEEIILVEQYDYTFDPRFNFDLSFFGGLVKPSFNFTDSLLRNYANSNDFIGTNKSFTPQITMTSFGAELSASYFFDRKRKIGFGVGFQYQLINGEIKTDNFKVSYNGKDKFDFSNIRTVEAQSFNEKFTANSLNIPLLLKYRNKISKKFKYEIAAGANISLSLMGTSDVSNNFIDYKRKYRINKDNNVVYSLDESLNELDIDEAQNQRPDEKNSDFKFSGGLGWIVKPSLYYTLSSKLSLNLGFLLMITNYNNKLNADRYQITDKVGEYNSILNGIPKFTNQNYFLNLGLRYSIK